MTYMQALLGFALVAGSMALLPGLDMMVLITLACMAAFFAGRLKSGRSRRVLSLVSAGIMAVLGGVTVTEAIRSRLAA